MPTRPTRDVFPSAGSRGRSDLGLTVRNRSRHPSLPSWLLPVDWVTPLYLGPFRVDPSLVVRRRISHVEGNILLYPLS